MNFLTLNVNCIGSSSKKRTLQVYSVCTSLLLLFRNILLLGWLEGRTQAHRQKEIGSHATLTAASVEFDLPDRHFYSNLKMALLDHVTKRDNNHRLHWLFSTPVLRRFDWLLGLNVHRNVSVTGLSRTPALLWTPELIWPSDLCAHTSRVTVFASSTLLLAVQNGPAPRLFVIHRVVQIALL